MKESNKISNPFFEPNKTVAVIGYLFLNLIGGSMLLILLGSLYNKTHHLGFSLVQISSILSETDMKKLNDQSFSLYIFSNSYGNLLMYLLMIIIVAFYMRDTLVMDARALIKDHKKLAWLIPLMTIAGYILSSLVDYGIEKIVDGTSMNQSSIAYLLQNGGAIPMFFAVVLFAPIVEELIYRKAIFSYLKNKPIILSYIVSTIIFMLPHMVSTFLMGSEYASIGNQLLMCIPYLVSGLFLCLTYHLCNKNVYASWFLHFINNLLAFVLILI